MGRPLKPPCGLDKHSGTENLYWAMFRRFPSQDILKENLPVLDSIFENVPGMQMDRIRRFYGIECKRLEPEEIAELYGLKYVHSIYEPMRKGFSKLFAYANTIRLLYTPFFPELWHCTEIGHCPLYRGIGQSKENRCPHELEDIIERVIISEAPCQYLRPLQRRFPDVPQNEQ